ncbi:MAG: hypothetical protein IJT32_06665 [Lachnospiraceae bacterium]|nr:hypothetical protein [Lachnospiraceae bacterium]
MGILSSLLGIGDMRKSTGNAVLQIEDADAVVCQFNPDELQVQTQGKFATVPSMGKDSPTVQYMGGIAASLDVILYFDTSTSYEIKTNFIPFPKKNQPEDVSSYANTLLCLTKIDGKLHRPPIVCFSWGSFVFGGFVDTVSVKYTMFESGGMPVRCEAAIHMVAQSTSVLGSSKAAPFESPDRTKCVVLKQGMNLYDIAREEYGDAGEWRRIARANGIMNPLAIPVGTRLVVPAIT